MTQKRTNLEINQNINNHKYKNDRRPKWEFFDFISTQ